MIFQHCYPRCPSLVRTFRGLLTLMALSLCSSSVQAQSRITTTGSWDGISNAPLLSRDFTSSTVGQTFLVPNGMTTLAGLSFFLGYAPFYFPTDLDFKVYAYVYGWNGAAPTTQLWRSSLQNGESDVPIVQRDVTTSIPVTAGDKYVLFLSALESDPFDPFDNCFTDPVAKCPAYQNLGITSSNAYNAGELVQAYANSWGELQAAQWAVDAEADLAFNFHFDATPIVDPPVTVIPEPQTVKLVGLGLSLAIILLRRRVGRLAL